MVKNRIFYYDLLRALAIIAVMMCHIDLFFGAYDGSILKFAFHSVFHGIGLVGVPIFLMLTGALLLNKEYDLSYFLKRRFSRIIIPFIFWIIIILTVGALYFKWDTQTMFGVFSGNGTIMWYIWMLVGIYLFIPVINSFFREYNFKGVEYFLIIWFVTIILRTFQLWPVFPAYELNTNFELCYFADFIGYPILGYYLANKEFNIDNVKMLIIGFLIFVVSLGYYVYMDFNHASIGPLYQNLTNVFMGIGFFLTFKYLDKLDMFKHIQDNLIGKFITSISICSYGMYFDHFILINYFEPFGIHSNKFILLILVAMVLLSWSIIYILSKIPYLKKVCGV